jgi:diguanylate cyclase (GGDEF)-like protein/PAS domain S-box-containing protein
LLERRLRLLQPRARAQTAALALIRARLRSEMDSEPGTVAVLDRQGRVVDANRAWRRFGCAGTPGRTRGGIGADYFAPCEPVAGADAALETARGVERGCADEANVAIADVLAGRRPFASLDYPSESANQKRCFEMTVTPIHAARAQGAIVRHLDITGRAEERNELRRQNEFVRAIDDSLPVIMYERIIMGDDWEYRFTSDRFVEVFGYPPDGPGRTWSKLLHPDDRARISRSYARALSLGGGTWRAEFRARTILGNVAWFRAMVRIEVRDGREVRSIGILHDISDEKLSEERAARIRERDELTGLSSPNRLERTLAAALERWIATGRCFAVVVVDIDEFREFNAAYGVEAGDSVLCGMAKTLRDLARADELVARIGWDQFAFVGFSESLAEGRTFAQLLVDRLSVAYPVGDASVTVTVSAGVALPEDPDTTSAGMLHNASIAVAAATAAGGHTERAYSTAMGADNLARMTLKTDLRDAEALGQFELYYQPKVDIASGRVSGCEALIRWNHPTLGLQPPVMFIPASEATGSIVPIGEWVLHEACRQSVRWRQAGIAAVPIAVNVSAIQFASTDVFEVLWRAFAATGAGPGAIDIEVTESVFIGFSDELVSTLAKIRGLGVEIALDDFGTGFSSLACLARLPLSILKIDQSFVRGAVSNSSDAAIVRWVVRLARELGLRAVAEGVETEEQLEFLRSIGCAEAQGFYYSGPVPADDFVALLGTFPALLRAPAGPARA